VSDSSDVPWVCVTGASGDVGHGVLRGLRRAAPPPKILALDWSADCPAFHYADRGEQVPPLISDEYVDALCDAISRVEARLLFLGVDGEIAKLARNRTHIEKKTGCEVVVAPLGVVELAVDKLRAASWLEGMGVGTPRTVGEGTALEIVEQLGLPLLAKPRTGHGSVGILRVDTVEELADFLAGTPNGYCYQSFIEGPEFTVGLLFDDEGTLIDSLTLERQLVGGRTVRGVVRRHPAIDACVNAFARGSGATGPMNLQLRLTREGQVCVFEVNPRISGSTALRVALGFNDPLRIYEAKLLGKPMRAADVAVGTRVYRVPDELVVAEGQP